MHEDPVVIVSAKRTAIGSFQGQFNSVTAPQLAQYPIQAVLEETGLEGPQVDEALLGCVLPAGVGQAPARQAILGAGLPSSVGCTTVNKVCGSGMKAAMIAHDLLIAGSANVVLAGGMESMSNTPYLLPKARDGFRMGHQQAIDHMLYDGLENAYDHVGMGIFGEMCAEKYDLTREAQDAFAIESVTRSKQSIESGAFDSEIVEVSVATRKETVVVKQDEQPFRSKIEKIPNLRPAFKKDGTVTAATSSSISDGAAVLLLMRESEAKRRSLTPLARVVGHSGHSHEPEWFTTAPSQAIEKLHRKIGWSPNTVDLYEINEAFASVTMGVMHELELEHSKVNVNGGACALGHPIGASGARIVVTLLHALKQRNLRKGVAGICIGGGESTAIAVELY